MSQPEHRNYILDYWQAIESGEVVVGQLVRKQYEKLVSRIHNPKPPYAFDLDRAMEPIVFIETMCKQAQGTNRGKPLTLELFQRAKFQAMFGFIHEETGDRQYREVMTVEGRKNGKTTENSALALFMLVGDAENSAECYFVATKKDQANKGFDEAHKMVMQSPSLSRHIRKRQGDLYFGATMSKLQSLASNSNSLDGLNSHFVTIDELAAIKDRDLYDVMKQSTSSREQAMVSSISTNGFVRNGIYDSQFDYAKQVIYGTIEDERFLAFLYVLDDPKEWDDESCWMKANPGLGTIKKVDELRAFVAKAKVDAAFRPTVLTKDFNISQTSNHAWMSMQQLDNPTTFDLSNNGFKYAIGGFDLSETTDFTAACVLLQKPNDPHIYIKSMFWLPGDLIAQRAQEDKMPYDRWHEQGFLRASGSTKIDKQDVLNWFSEIDSEHDIRTLWVGHDPAYVDEGFREDCHNQFGANNFIRVRQGAYTLSMPMKEIAADFSDKRIIYDNNPLMKLCLANTVTVTDANGNIRPVKGRDRRKRIDGTIALLCAYRVYMDNNNDYNVYIQ